MEKKNTKPFLISSIIFALLLVIFFNEFIFDSTKLMLNSDQLNGLGSRYLRAESIDLSQWDDSRLGGVPTIDAFFADAYHPLVFMQMVMDAGRAVGFKFIITIWIAFVSAFLLFTYITKKWQSGALLATLFALNPQFFSHIYGGHDGKMMVMSIAPLGIWATFKITREAKLSGVFWLSISIIWMLLSGHIQMSYFFLWGLLLFSLYENFVVSKNLEMKYKIIRQVYIGLALLIALMVSSTQVFPPYSYTTEYSVRGSDAQTTIGHASSWSLHPEEIASIAIPGFLDTDVKQERKYWGHNSFKLNHDTAGVLLLTLAFMALALRSNRKFAPFWLSGITLCLFYAVGANTPLFKVFFNLVPGVKNFRAPAMVIFWVPLSLAIIAAMIFKNDNLEKLKSKALPMAGLFVAGLLLVIISRFMWIKVLSGLGIVFVLVYAWFYNGMLYILQDDKEFSISAITEAWKSKFSGFSKLALVGYNMPLIFLLFLFFPGQDLSVNPETASYFSGLNLNLMSSTSSEIIPLGIIALATAIAGILILISKQTSLIKYSALIVLAIVDTMIVNMKYIQNVDYANYIQPDNQYIQAIKKSVPDSLNNYAVLAMTKNPALSNNIYPLYGMRNVMGFHDNEVASFREFRGGRNSDNLLKGGLGNNAFLDLLNVGFLIVDTQQGTQIMSNSTAFARTRVYNFIEQIDEDKIIDRLKDLSFDHRNIMLLSNKAKLKATYPSKPMFVNKEIPVAKNLSDSMIADSLKPQVKVVKEAKLFNATSKIISSSSPSNFVIEVNSEVAGILMFSGNWLPYWKAKVNDQDSKVLKVFHTLRGVEVPAGKSIVKLYYQSDVIEKSKPFTIAGIILLIILAGLSIYFRFTYKKTKELS